VHNAHSRTFDVKYLLIDMLFVQQYKFSDLLFLKIKFVVLFYCYNLWCVISVFSYVSILDLPDIRKGHAEHIFE